MRPTFRFTFVPALLALSVLFWWRHAQIDAALQRGHWGIDAVTAGLLLALGVIWLAEQLFPAVPEWNYNIARDPVRGLNRLGRDLFYLTLVALMNGALTGLLAHRVNAWSATLNLPTLWPNALPFAVKVLLAFLIVELGSYAYHWLAHHVEFLWGFHATHHVLTEVTGLKALRTHPFDNALFYLPRTLPLLALGAGVDEMLAATFFGCVFGVLSHANIDVDERGLGWFINFPSYHRVHHSSDVDESRSNYGCHTVLWDRVFGTFRARKGDAAIGVAPVGTRTLWQELVWPFYRPVGIEPTARPARP